MPKAFILENVHIAEQSIWGCDVPWAILDAC